MNPAEPGGRTPGQRRLKGEVKSMVHRDGKWWYKGKVFDTLHEALLSAWPK